MKNKKMNLNSFKIESFITSAQTPKIETIIGGSNGLSAASGNFLTNQIHLTFNPANPSSLACGPDTLLIAFCG